MRYTVGVDLGTTFTAAAVRTADGTRMVALSQEIVVPAVACHTPDGKLLTGHAAMQAAAGTPARLVRGFKRRLGDPTPLVLGGAAYSPAALMAAQLRDVLDQVTRAMAAPPESVVLTCPAIWGPYRREQFAEVPRLAGLGDHEPLTEPEAAARHYSRERTLGDGEVVAVYDLGGGTLDTTVLRMRGGAMEILGTPEGVEHLGGMDFDDALLAHLDERLDGAISGLDPADPAAAGALAAIRARCVRAKVELSTEPDVTVAVPLPSGPREVTVTRREFNDAIRPSVALTTDALRRTIESAGLRTDDLSAVLLAGGSSRIPLVTQAVHEEFGTPVRVSQHPKYTVALGAATTATPAATVTATAPVPVPPPPPAPAPRRRWLLPAAAGVVVLVATLVAALVVFGPDDGHAVAQARSGPLVVFDDDFAGPYRGYVASAEKWDGTEVLGGRAAHTAVAAEVSDGLRVTWSGAAPGQVYLQSVNAVDLSSFVDDGALRFDVVVHASAGGAVSVAAHCRYPCGAELPLTEVFRGLSAGERARVTIPVRCFTEAGLDASVVNTPFLVYGHGALDVTFRDVEWVRGAASAADALSCEELS
ncbi:Hsp70 family protein [Actinophytocola sp. NPDC049390]|uniref:Hsp70 family protein n=1 Tax=Actinophytocola sp. NPDC049390 TaxID=3363894 RepID=UPI00379A4123